LGSGLKIALGFFRTFDFVKIVAILILNNLSLTVLVRHKVYLSSSLIVTLKTLMTGGKEWREGKKKREREREGAERSGLVSGSCRALIQGTNLHFRIAQKENK
jgi:hypothetical protein